MRWFVAGEAEADRIDINIDAITHIESHDSDGVMDDCRARVHFVGGSSVDLVGWEAAAMIRELRAGRFGQVPASRPRRKPADEAARE